MPGTWINHATVRTARNGTTTHTAHPDGTGGTVSDGVAFTPTAGNLLICVFDASVTATTPTGWTLPSGGSAINNTQLSVWYRASASGTSADQVATTHNVANYPAVFDFYEFAPGSSFGASVSATAVADNGAGPNLTGLSNTPWVAGVFGGARAASNNTANTITWSAGTEAVDVSEAFSSTDGYNYSLTYVEDYGSASAQWSADLSASAPVGNCERLMFWVDAADPGVVDIDLTYVASSAWVAPASSTTISPTYPAGIQEGDVVYAELVIKPDTATVATPTNWTLVASAAQGGGTQGAGTGAVKTHLYKRVVPSGGLSGSQAFTITSGSSPVACMRAFRPDASATSVTFTESTTSYSRTTASTTFGGTGGANLNLAAKDFLVYISASSDDQSLAHTISALAATGATLATRTQDPAGTIVNAQGNDISAASAYSLVTAGTSSAAPSATVTGDSAETGGGFFYKVSATGALATSTTGTSAISLPPLTEASAGTVTDAAAVANTLPPLASSATGTASANLGTSAITLPHVTEASAGTVTDAAAAADTLPPLASVSTGVPKNAAAVADTLPPLGSSATGIPADAAAATNTLPPLGSVATGTSKDAGAVADTLPPLAALASANVTDSAASAVALPPLASSGTVSSAGSAASAVTLPPLASTATGTSLDSGASAVSLPPLAASAAGSVAETGASSSTLPPLSSSITASSVNAGSEAASLPPIASSGSANVTDPGASAAGLPPLQAAGDATTEIPGTSNSFIVLPSLESAATGVSRTTGASAASLPALSAALSGDLRASGTSVGVLPPLQGAVDATAAILGLSVALLPALRSLVRLDTDSHGSILTVEVGPDDLIEANIAPETFSGAIIDLAAGLEGHFA